MRSEHEKSKSVDYFTPQVEILLAERQAQIDKGKAVEIRDFSRHVDQLARAKSRAAHASGAK